MCKEVWQSIWEHWAIRFTLRPLLIAYVLLFLVGAFFADSLIFQNGRSSYEDSKDTIKLTTSDGVKISARYLSNPTAKYTILYSHGNAEDMGDDETDLEALQRLGFAVFAYDYHGYGTSQGKPSEAHLYADIDAAYAYLTGTLQTPPDRIIIYGRSLGGGPSIDLAVRKPVAGLVLQSAFTTAFRVITQVPLLPFDKFRNIEKIGRVRCPVLVMHGRADRVIPFRHGPTLYAAVQAPKRCLWVDGAGHDDLCDVAGDKYGLALQDFTALLDQTTRVPATP